MADRLWLFVLAVVALGAAGFAPLHQGTEAQRSGSAPAREAPRPPRLLEGEGPLFVLSGNEKGFIRPCGCSKPALGGIHRRATTIEGFREEAPGLWPVGLGDMIKSGGVQQEAKFETFLVAMSIMGYRAFAPGAGDLFLGPGRLKEMEALAGFPFVSLNLAREGELLFAEEAVIDGGPWRVTGLLPDEVRAPGFEVRPWKAALTAWCAELPESAKALVLWNGKEAGAEEVAAAIPETLRERVVIAFGGVGDQPRPVEAPVRLLSIGSKGRFLALLRPEESPDFVESVRLKEGIPFHPVVGQVLDGYRARLAEMDLVAKAPRVEGEIRYVGDQVCAECHGEICEQLDRTPHEHAWKTLFEYGDQVDPECVSCHVTGWGDSKGFLTFEKTPGLVNVTCESCHGPGELHVEEDEFMPRSRPTKDFCVTCHDADNSPHFDYETYWPKIAHPR